ncbi:MAG: DUF2085 domain-containing protein, partial [Candidatus Ranarchaeia archaeon]
GSHRPIFLCARCLGAYIGFIIGSLLLLFQIKIPSPYIEAVMYLFAAPAMIDWSTQTFGIRQSKNSIRIPTGVLYGFALPITFYELVFWLSYRSLLMLRPIGALIFYLSIAGLVFRYRNKRYIVDTSLSPS